MVVIVLALFFAVIHSCTPEVVFLDIDLPGMSGVEVAQKLRSTHTDIEIVFITSYTDFRSDAIELYAADYITKPINATRLIRTLQRITEMYTRQQRVLEIPVGDNIELIREQDKLKLEGIRPISIPKTMFLKRRGILLRKWNKC